MSDFQANGSLPPPPPQPRSPPHLYGKRREGARVQMLEREIGFLDEELKSLESIPPASRSCKEVAEFVTGNVDPLIPTIKKTRRSWRLWKWFCGACCFDFSRIYCCDCSCDLSMPRCCDCMTCNSCSNPCQSCGIPACRCFPCISSKCFKKWKCSLNGCCCCLPKRLCCPTCSCTRCTCYPKCPNLKNMCSCCNKSCCFPCYYGK
ncbi:guanine nucleotide-binding protein subunit gamma 3-like [Salvia splendens]|uniref:guanine nucleotide-binding protein subunit gamma 3-like n=1 Tax=Salvia splendens TaxID=180675 RepID=UPI001C269C08|nr:guanine nucleotide-binding protein subunit gamma 3-like [Salvia splendens]